MVNQWIIIFIFVIKTKCNIIFSGKLCTMDLVLVTVTFLPLSLLFGVPIACCLALRPLRRLFGNGASSSLRIDGIIVELIIFMWRLPLLCLLIVHIVGCLAIGYWCMLKQLDLRSSYVWLYLYL